MLCRLKPVVGLGVIGLARACVYCSEDEPEAEQSPQARRTVGLASARDVEDLAVWATPLCDKVDQSRAFSINSSKLGGVYAENAVFDDVGCTIYGSAGILAAFDTVQVVFQSADNTEYSGWKFQVAEADDTHDTATLEVVTDYVVSGIGLKVTLPKTIILSFDNDKKVIARHEEWWYGQDPTFNVLHRGFKRVHGAAISLFA